MGPGDVATVRFDREDCALFARYPKKVRWTPDNVSPVDQARFKDIWERLKQLVGWVAGQTRIDVPVRPFTSLYQANGLSQADIWCCLYPAEVPNKSFALQVAFIISGATDLGLTRPKADTKLGAARRGCGAGTGSARRRGLPVILAAASWCQRVQLPFGVAGVLRDPSGHEGKHLHLPHGRRAGEPQLSDWQCVPAAC
jgi:hypothetical protein